MVGGKAGWYLERLRRMSAAEVGWRAADQARKLTWARRQVSPGPGALSTAREKPELLPRRAFSSVLPEGALADLPPAVKRGTLHAADALMAGHWQLLGAERHDMGDPDWFYDPVTGRRAPQLPYCFKVDHRDEAVTGNVKQIWELSRLHHVTVLAAAYALSGEDRYAERAAAHLSSWWEQNPFLSGVNWTSGIEAGIRLISFAWTRRLLDAWPGAPGLFEENDMALAQIWWHHRYLEAFQSRGSSANNHVIAEAAGQLVGALAFPWFSRSQRWAVRAAELLEAELAHNTFPSGVNREMAFEYHGFVAELALLAAAEADRAGQPLSDDSWLLLARMLDVVAATVDEALGAPRYGDGDDGKALVLAGEGNRWESLLSAGRPIFGAPSWWPETGQSAFSACLIALAAKHPSFDRPERRPTHFSDAGVAVLRSGTDEGPEIWCRCDSGPHGFLSIAAHAHSDALSMELRHGGIEVLVDPGTYCYHGEPRWRAYFRSTLGHNTLELARKDQSVAGGPFLWSSHAESRLIAADLDQSAGPATWSAEHYGYAELVPPATHRRTVKLDRAARRLEVMDLVVTEGSHPYRLAWHFGPAVEVQLQTNVAELRWSGRDGSTCEGTMELPQDAEWSLVRGSDDPVLGWYSPSFGVKVPIWALVGRGTSTRGTKLVTTVQL